MLASAHGPSALWYATRGAGAVTLVLLTISVVLGIGEIRRWRPAGAPRFAVAAIHRTASLLALAVLAVHIVTTLLDPFPRIGLLTAVVPFATSYRPLWLGLGTLASDLLVALVITSLLRRRLGFRAWRNVHWLAYACWPVAVLHGAGTGSDVRRTWMLALTVTCVAAVGMAVVSRLAAPDASRQARGAGAVTLAAAALAFALWLPQGPLAHGWARRAGTPASVLAAFAPRPATAPARAAVARPAVDPLAQAFTASLSGAVRNGTSRTGIAVADLSMRLHGGPRGRLRIRLGGESLPGGGLRMHRSEVSLGPPDDPGRYRGRIETLQNTNLRALVASNDGHALRLTVQLELAGGSVRGQVAATPIAQGSA